VHSQVFEKNETPAVVIKTGPLNSYIREVAARPRRCEVLLFIAFNISNYERETFILLHMEKVNIVAVRLLLQILLNPIEISSGL
jgi:hypothetical protein